MYYLLNSSMQPLDDNYRRKDDDTLVSVVTTEECPKKHGSLPYYRILARNIENHNIQYCKAEMLPDCIIGTLLIPDKQSPRQHILSLSFYLEKGLLVLVDDTCHIENILSIFREAELLNSPDTGSFFWSILSAATDCFFSSWSRRWPDWRRRFSRPGRIRSAPFSCKAAAGF